MSEQELSSIDPRLQKQVANAKRAIEKGNPGYAVPICSDILKRFPGLYDVRKILRTAQKRMNGNSGGVKKFFAKVTSAPFALGSAGRIKKDPNKVIESAEALLADDPSNVAAHRILGQAAEELGYHNTAIFAYECVREVEPDNVENLKSLAEALIEVGRNKESIALCDTILARSPADGDAQNIIRKASVAQSMEKGKWEEDKDFRDKLKDEDEAVRLEQASRSVTGEDALRDLIAEALKKAEKEPENLNVLRELTTNYRKLADYDNALLWIGKARSLESGKSDVALEKLEIQIIVESKEAFIEEKLEVLESDPSNAAARKEVETAQGELFETRYKFAESLVERYPNEYGYRFEFGELLLEKGELDQAIAQFQVSQRNPKVRIQSLLNLGKAFKAKKIFDLAAEQLSSANSELKIMNEIKKEVMYELANCFELKGDGERAIEEYKKLYSADIGYRDVAQKIDEFYSNAS
ncbi:MAG: tetratricopeptide repeat protein [Opitutales bacterium]